MKLYTTSASAVTKNPGEWDLDVVTFADKSKAVGSFHVTCLPPILVKSDGHWKTAGGTVSTEMMTYKIYIYCSLYHMMFKAKFVNPCLTKPVYQGPTPSDFEIGTPLPDMSNQHSKA